MAYTDATLSDASPAQGIPTPIQVEISEDKEQQLKAWLRVYIPELQAARDSDISNRTKKWRDTLRGIRHGIAPSRRKASNISTPLTVWAAAAIRARIRQAVVEQKPVVSATPLKSTTEDGLNLDNIASAYSKVFQAEFDSPRGLGGAQAVEKGIDDAVDIGTAAFKVYEETKLPHWAINVDGTLALQPAKSRIRWDYISILDLIYADGYGDDTQAMPLVGHEYNMQWYDMAAWAREGYFRDAALKRVAAFYETPDHTESLPAKLKSHRLAELYLEFCTKDGEPESSLLITWHCKAGEILRIAYNPTPRGVRPIYIAQFDREPDPTKARGQGVCEKLEGAQDETDEIHNLGLEAAKRATAHVIGLKAGTGAESEFGGDQPAAPGDNFVTDDPSEDLVAVPLGDPKAVEVALAQEANTRQYVSRMLGLDEAAIGDVQSGKRVPASLGLSIQREGRVIAVNAINAFANVLTQMAYLTGDLWKRRPPAESIAAVMNIDEARAFQQACFSTTEISTRQQFVLVVSAQDAASSMEERKNELMMVNQVLAQYAATLMQYGQLAMQIQSPPIQNAIMLLLQKMENGTRQLLNTIDSVANPSDLLFEVAILADAIKQASAQMAPPMPGMPQPGGMSA